eukprot:Gb_05919 [translate_table: standard]
MRGLSLVFGGSVVWNRDSFGRPCAWPADAFANMKELKLLELEDDCVEGDLGKLPQELIWLRWRNYPYECMPPNLRINHARVLDFCGGKLVSLWDNQSQVPLKLQELNLQRCYKLQRVPDSIGRLRGLQKLDFSHCLLLKTLSEEFCYLESLEVLKLNSCFNLEYLPSGFAGMRRLQYVELRKCKKLKALPESFGLLPQIEYLDMENCKNVKVEEGSFGSISTLKDVILLNCPKMKTLPTQLTCQRSLKMLSVGTVDSLEEKNSDKDSGAIAGFGHNGIFTDIPENIGDLSHLTVLRLGNLTRIPQSIGNLSQLETVQLWGLANIRAIPDSIGQLCRLQELCLWDCPQLEELPSSVGHLSRLRVLRLLYCPRLQGLLTSISNLSRLQSLSLVSCPGVEKGLPASLANLASLEEFALSDCVSLQRLPTCISNLSGLICLNLQCCARLKEIEVTDLDLSSCSDLQNITGLSSLKNLIALNLNDCHKLTERASLALHQRKHLRWLNLPLTNTFLTEENSVLLENLISRSLNFTFTASAIPYPTAWLYSYHFQMMSKQDTMPFVSGSSGLKCTPPLAQLCFEWEETEGTFVGYRFSHSKLGDSIHLKLFSVDEYPYIKENIGLNVFMDKLSSSVKGYFKYGWIKIIGEGEENLIQQICSDFFRELRRQRPLAAARASAPSLLDLRNVHALDIANCTIRRTLYLYKTPIEEEKMELVLRKKQLFWRDDKELEHLDLSIMNSTSISLFLTLKSMVNLYNMEVIISARNVEAYKDELQEYDYQDNSVINSHANIPIQVAKILESRELLNESILKSNKRGKDRHA